MIPGWTKRGFPGVKTGMKRYGKPYKRLTSFLFAYLLGQESEDTSKKN